MAVDSLRSGFSPLTSTSLNKASKDLSESSNRLSSGKRINKAADDAAGLAIANALLAEEATSRVASRNINDGRSIADIQDAAVSSISDISVRQAELAAQAANGTLSDDQRQALNNEYQQLGQEAQRIAATSEFNGVNVFSSGVSLQVGNNSQSTSQISLSGADTAALTGGIGDILTADAAKSALDSANSRINTAATTRGELGSSVSRLDYAQANVENSIVAVAGARSRIEDADVADEVAKRTSASIRQQTSTAIAAQANVTQQAVLRLLQ